VISYNYINENYAKVFEKDKAKRCKFSKLHRKFGKLAPFKSEFAKKFNIK